ncbi:MAG: gluconate 2-dehydrogenase subunit 3 family protein [Phycisphaerales bacterium]|nr:gluconate 2-dehydrogenase subunit 3 family protein [Phycisphaerales bacterium]
MNSTGESSPENATAIRVATYNIKHGRGMDGTIDLERTAATLEALKADLIALQEVDDQARRSGGVDQAAWLEAELDARAKGDFLKAAPDAQARLLTALDAEAYAEGVREHPWRTVKALILIGYYTSESGGSQELQFNLVPGTYDPDVPVTPQTRAFSSDWTAVDFG